MKIEKLADALMLVTAALAVVLIVALAGMPQVRAEECAVSIDGMAEAFAKMKVPREGECVLAQLKIGIVKPAGTPA
jgi:hypothetical protein